MKHILSIVVALLLFSVASAQITEASVAKEWKVKEVLSMTVPPEAKSPERERQVKEMLLKGSFSIRKDHSFSCDLGAFTFPPGYWSLDSSTGEVVVLEKDSKSKEPEPVIGFIVKHLSPTQAIFSFPDGDVVMFALKVEAK